MCSAQLRHVIKGLSFPTPPPPRSKWKNWTSKMVLLSSKLLKMIPCKKPFGTYTLTLSWHNQVCLHFVATGWPLILEVVWLPNQHDTGTIILPHALDDVLTTPHGASLETCHDTAATWPLECLRFKIKISKKNMNCERTRHRNPYSNKSDWKWYMARNCHALLTSLPPTVQGVQKEKHDQH